MLDFLFEKVESMEFVELIKIDFEKKTKMAISALTMKEGYTIQDINIPEHIEMLKVLKQEGNRYIVLVKVKFFKQFAELVDKFNIDIIWDTPSLYTPEKIMWSVMGDEENLKKFLDVIKLIGEVKKISFKKASFNEQSILSCLTNKQREILIEAKKNGYYKYPRRINSEELSKKVGLSKPTVVQHLRKAEIRIISNILTGY